MPVWMPRSSPRFRRSGRRSRRVPSSDMAPVSPLVRLSSRLATVGMGEGVRAALPAVLALVLASCVRSPASSADAPEDVHLPPGFTIAIWARVPGARQMALGEHGTVFVGTTDEGKVYAVRPPAGAGEPEVLTVDSGLKVPN